MGCVFESMHIHSVLVLATSVHTRSPNRTLQGKGNTMIPDIVTSTGEIYLKNVSFGITLTQLVSRHRLLSLLKVSLNRNGKAEGEEVKRNMVALWFPGSLGQCSSWMLKAHVTLAAILGLFKGLAHFQCADSVGTGHPSVRERFQVSRESIGIHFYSWKPPHSPVGLPPTRPVVNSFASTSIQVSLLHLD